MEGAFVVYVKAVRILSSMLRREREKVKVTRIIFRVHFANQDES